VKILYSLHYIDYIISLCVSLNFILKIIFIDISLGDSHFIVQNLYSFPVHTLYYFLCVALNFILRIISLNILDLQLNLFFFKSFEM
jgi:hypothetical protein